MSEKRPLSVEVFRDVDRRHVTTDAAEQGVELIRDIAPGLVIIRSTRLIRIAEASSESIDLTKVRFPHLEADVNVILTDRMLEGVKKRRADDTAAQEERGLVTGLTPYSTGVNAQRVTVIRSDSPGSGYTMAHKLAHMLGLKRGGETYDGNDHCINSECIMHFIGEAVAIKEMHYIRNSRLQRLGLKEATREERIVGSRLRAESFCSECARQLGQNAFFLQKAKAGEVVLPSLIP